MYLKVTQPGWATVLPPQLEIWIETLYILIENYHPDNRAQLQSLWCRWVVITVCINSLTAAKQNKECSNGGTSSSNATCSNNATCSSKARSVVNYWVFYQGLTTVAYAFILNGLAWWIVFAVAASATPNESKVTLLYMMCSIYQVCSIRRYMGFTKQVVSCPDLIWHFQYKMQVVMLIMIHAWVGFGSGTDTTKQEEIVNPYQSSDDTAVECETEAFSTTCAVHINKGLWCWWLSSGCSSVAWALPGILDSISGDCQLFQ